MGKKIYSVGIYARLSVEGGTRKNESIETQIEIAREYMKGQDDMVLYGCYSDLGRTGTNFEREGFERLMEDVRFRRVDCIIVKDFSRFGRNYIETGNYIQKIFPFLGVRFVSVTDCFDSLFAENDDMGVNLKNLANEMYARDIGLKVKSSKRAKRESGSYVGGIPPYGYYAERSCGRRRLLAEAGTAEIVKDIFRQYDRGRSLKEIAVSLYARQVHRPTEYRRYGHLRRQPGEELHEWPRTSIKAILTNPIYAGCMTPEASGSGSYTCQRLKGDGARRIEGREEGVNLPLRENSHQAIVDQEQFSRVAGRFAQRAGKTRERAFCEEKDIFDGVLFCGCCGRKLGRRSLVKRSYSGQELGGCRYFCNNSSRIDDFSCRTGTLSKDELTEIVITALRQEAALNDIRAEKLAGQNLKCAMEYKNRLLEKCRAIQKKLDSAYLEGSERYRKYREGGIGREVFLKWKEQSDKETEQTRDSLEKEKRRICETEREAKRQESLLRELAEFSAGREPDRECILALIQRINLYPDKRVEIVFRFHSGGFMDEGGEGGRRQ